MTVGKYILYFKLNYTFQSKVWKQKYFILCYRQSNCVNSYRPTAVVRPMVRAPKHDENDDSVNDDDDNDVMMANLSTDDDEQNYDLDYDDNAQAQDDDDYDNNVENNNIQLIVNLLMQMRDTIDGIINHLNNLAQQ